MAHKPTPPFDETSFITSFQQGKQDAFKLLTNDVEKHLFNFVSQFVKDKDQAENLVAECISRLFHHRTQMQSYDQIHRWLFVVARNLCIDTLHKRLAENQRLKELALFQELFTPDIETQRVTAQILSTLQHDLHQAINNLPPQRKSIITLLYFENKTTQEIADILQISIQTVLNHKAKALDALRHAGLKIFFDQ